MTQDEIIEMAKQAGWKDMKDYDSEMNESFFIGKFTDLKTFAKLVAQHEREKSLKLWMLLDDIDTADDIAKTDHDTYRRLCRNTQQKRWAVLSESEVDAAIRARGQA
jgi:hypothetical protein